MQPGVSGRILFQQVQISSFLPNICMNIRMKILRIFKEGSFYGWITLCAMCTTMCTLHKGDCWLKVLIPHLGQSYYFCRRQRKKWKKKPKSRTVYVYVSKSVIEDKRTKSWAKPFWNCVSLFVCGCVSLWLCVYIYVCVGFLGVANWVCVYACVYVCVCRYVCVYVFLKWPIE